MSFQEISSFLDASPTPWHAVETIQKVLAEAGYEQILEEEAWELQEGKKYMVSRQGSALCTFTYPRHPQKISILACHTDSPCLKLRPNPDYSKQDMGLLSVEVYGSPLLTSWLNRDLAPAGKVFFLDQQGNLKNTLVDIKEYSVIIPQLAIHLDRKIHEEGLKLNKQEHLNALSTASVESNFMEFLKNKLNAQTIISHDIFLYPLEKASQIGINKEMVASYRIDNLASACAITHALKHTPISNQKIDIGLFFDHEEIGSETLQGANSSFFSDIFKRICFHVKLDTEQVSRIKRNSICLSIDGAHGVHPNHANMHDPLHLPTLGNGFVFKANSQKRYATDAQSLSSCLSVCYQNKIPFQIYSHRNDIPCGSTIGPIFSAKEGIPTVDLGLPQLSMHSIREIASVADYENLCHFLNTFLTS